MEIHDKLYYELGYILLDREKVETIQLKVKYTNLFSSREIRFNSVLQILISRHFELSSNVILLNYFCADQG